MTGSTIVTNGIVTCANHVLAKLANSIFAATAFKTSVIIIFTYSTVFTKKVIDAWDWKISTFERSARIAQSIWVTFCSMWKTSRDVNIIV